MEQTKYYVIKVDNFYLQDFYLSDEDVKTHFVHALEFTTIKTNAHTFTSIDDANMTMELFVKLGFVSASVDSIII